MIPAVDTSGLTGLRLKSHREWCSRYLLILGKSCPRYQINMPGPVLSGPAFLLLEFERPVDMHVALRKRNDDIVFLEYPVNFESNRATNAAKCPIFG